MSIKGLVLSCGLAVVSGIAMLSACMSLLSAAFEMIDANSGPEERFNWCKGWRGEVMDVWVTHHTILLLIVGVFLFLASFAFLYWVFRLGRPLIILSLLAGTLLLAPVPWIVNAERHFDTFACVDL